MTMESNVTSNTDADHSKDPEKIPTSQIDSSNSELEANNNILRSSHSRKRELQTDRVKKPPGLLDDSDFEAEDEEWDTEPLNLNLGDTSLYTVKQRNALFQRGLCFEKKDRSDAALKCYLGCVHGLKNKTSFALLPECLKNIADIYRTKGEYENAIQFAQAEKLFYETALIETREIQRKIEEITGKSSNQGSSNAPANINDLNIDIMRADEYEDLARLCLDNKQAQLALEYAGKCSQLRQQVYGNNHKKTKETLDFFASLYAEAGKEQYSDSINMMIPGAVGELEKDEEGNDEDSFSIVPEVIMTAGEAGEPVSILRQRTLLGVQDDTENSADKKKQVRFHESVDDSIRRKRKEEIVSLTITLVLLFVCFLILASLGLWLYCSMDRVQSCPAIVARLKSWFMIIRYKVHQLTTSTQSKMEYSR